MINILKKTILFLVIIILSVFLFIGYKIINSIPVSIKQNSLDLEKHMSYATDFINLAAMLLTGFGIIVASVGLLSFYQFHKTSEIRKEAESILDSKKNELLNLQIKHTSDVLIIFSGYIKSFINVYEDVFKLLNEVLPYSQNVDSIKDRIKNNKDQLNNIQKINSDDKQDVLAALYSISASKIKEFSLILDYFILCHEKDKDYKEILVTAKNVKKNLSKK